MEGRIYDRGKWGMCFALNLCMCEYVFVVCGLFVSMHTCMYVCLDKCMYTDMHDQHNMVCMYAHTLICMYSWISVCIQTCMTSITWWVCMHIHLYVCMYTFLHAEKMLRLHSYTHINMHTHIHTHTARFLQVEKGRRLYSYTHIKHTQIHSYTARFLQDKLRKSGVFIPVRTSNIHTHAHTNSAFSTSWEKAAHSARHRRLPV